MKTGEIQSITESTLITIHQEFFNLPKEEKQDILQKFREWIIDQEEILDQQ